MQAAPAAPPYTVPPPVLQSWLTFIAPKAGRYGRLDFDYDYNILKSYLTPRLGGHRQGGGGGDYEFRLCLRLIPEL